MQLLQEKCLKEDPARAQKFVTAFLAGIHQILTLDVDYSGDKRTEIYLKNGYHQKTLSMQLSLGYWGEQKRRSLPSKIAYAILQLRWAALTFAMGLKPPANGPAGGPDPSRTETVRSFLGIVSWTLSLMNFIIDELFTLSNATGDHGFSSHVLVEEEVNKRNTPALALIFVSQSRLLFKYLLRFIRNLGGEAMHYKTQDPTWREFGKMVWNSPVPMQQYEKVIADVESNVRAVYDSNQVSDAERKELEKTMLITGSVPSKLWPAVESLLTKTMSAVKEEVNTAELFFQDISWLGLSDDGASGRWRKDNRLDVIRKVVLGKKVRVRRCTRCCSATEDSMPPKGTAGYLVNMWRSCVCGNWWMVTKEQGAGV
ncbi:MAG: hypothetical protein Q9183_002598 [Haloplaca sp. 2 TL-2023]